MNMTFAANDTEHSDVEDQENVLDLKQYRDARFPNVDDILDRLSDDTCRAAGDTA